MTRLGTMAGIAALAAAMAMAPFGESACAAVSNAVRKACEKKADQVRPALRAGEREAYIANCIADATATKGKH